MKEIELIIKIPEEIRLALINNVQLSIDQQSICDSCIKQAIVNGTPLPKGHGELIDRSKIYKAIPAEEDNCTGAGMTLEEMDAYNDGIDAMYSRVKGAPTIIDADKGYKQ